MNALIILSVAAAAQASVIAPAAYSAGLPLAYNGAPLAYSAPIAAPAAVAPVAPITAPSSQFQAQDEFGNLNYGYSNINSAKQEVGNTYGGVTGSYSYVDAYGIPQRVDYIADALGFRVKATNLPVAPATPVAPAVELPVAPVYTAVGPAPVEETAEVKAAKAEFLAKFEEAKNREKRSVVPAATLPLAYNTALPYSAGLAYNTALPYATGLPYNTALPYAAGLAYNTALPYAATTLAAPAAVSYATPAVAAPVAAGVVGAPAARDAVLTKIKLNPGHAIAYRVD